MGDKRLSELRKYEREIIGNTQDNEEIRKKFEELKHDVIKTWPRMLIDHIPYSASHLIEKKEEEMEKALADEITLLYYLNLLDDEFYFPDGKDMKYSYVRVSKSSENYDFQPLVSSARHNLLSILKEDKQIKTWLFSSIEDVVRYHLKYFDAIDHLQKDSLYN